MTNKQTNNMFGKYKTDGEDERILMNDDRITNIRNKNPMYGYFLLNFLIKSPQFKNILKHPSTFKT